MFVATLFKSHFGGARRTPPRKIPFRLIPTLEKFPPLRKIPPRQIPLWKTLPHNLFSNYFYLKNVSPLKNLIFYLQERLT